MVELFGLDTQTPIVEAIECIIKGTKNGKSLQCFYIEEYMKTHTAQYQTVITSITRMVIPKITHQRICKPFRHPSIARSRYLILCLVNKAEKKCLLAGRQKSGRRRCLMPRKIEKASWQYVIYVGLHLVPKTIV